MGSEWASYATPVAGSGRRAVAQEIAEEAGKWSLKGWWRSLRKPPIVIGENMERVSEYARRIGAETIDDWMAKRGLTWSEAVNREFILSIIAEGRRVIDIGPDFIRRIKYRLKLPDGRPPSSIYGMERRLLEGYPYYKKKFRRFKDLGGVPGYEF